MAGGPDTGGRRTVTPWPVPDRPRAKSLGKTRGPNWHAAVRAWEPRLHSERRATAMATAATTFVPFSPPSVGADEIAEVVATLESGWLTTGPRVRRFEAEFAAYTGAPHAVAVNSCT